MTERIVFLVRHYRLTRGAALEVANSRPWTSVGPLGFLRVHKGVVYVSPY